MDDEILDYINYILDLVEIKRPLLPDFDVDKFESLDYKFAIEEIMKDFQFADFEMIK